SAFLARAEAPPANYIYVPSCAGRAGMTPDLAEAELVLTRCARLRPAKLILLSSALIYGAGTARQALAGEGYAPPRHGRDEISSAWRSLEAAAAGNLQNVAPLVILRPVTVLPSPSLLARRLARRLPITLAGHDPTLQLLSMEDLAAAVLGAVRSNAEGAL